MQEVVGGGVSKVGTGWDRIVNNLILRIMLSTQAG